MSGTIKTINTGVLSIAYLEYGPASGWPCILGHGFPYDAHAYDQAAPILAQAGARVIVPYLRGYGPTRFLKAETPRSGEQAALGVDLLDFMDALKIERAVLGGYDWGGRAACIVSALLPNRVVALVSGNSYNIQSIAHAMEPASPAEEAAFWYQYYFHNERGRRGLRRTGGRSRASCGACGRRTGRSTTRPSIERRAPSTIPTSSRSSSIPIGIVTGSRPAPAILGTMRLKWDSRLSRAIAVPAITIDGDADGVNPGTAHHAKKFTGPARTSHIRGRRPQPAAGAAGGMGARGHRRAEDGERLRNERGHQPLPSRGRGYGIGDHRLSRRRSGSSGLTARSLPTFSVRA